LARTRACALTRRRFVQSCAVHCHAGHPFSLKHSSGAYCDCGEGKIATFSSCVVSAICRAVAACAQHDGPAPRRAQLKEGNNREIKLALSVEGGVAREAAPVEPVRTSSALLVARGPRRA
jgi:hypothetical protein